MKIFNRVGVVLTLLFCFAQGIVHAQLLPPPDDGWDFPTNLSSWSFDKAPTDGWASDLGYAPLSFTNISSTNVGDYVSLLLDSTNPASLQYNVFENDGTTNLTADSGTVSLWFSPNWASTTTNGSGPGVYGRLFEVGTYTSDASVGWWSLLTDPGATNLYFCTQTNSGDGITYTNLSISINWASNQWHNVVLTYSSTNSFLYLDGVQATNGSGVSAYPGLNVLTNGFRIGSDSNGLNQAHGLIDDVYTYNFPLDAGTVSNLYAFTYPFYVLLPWNNVFNDNIQSGSSSPSYVPQFDVITGQGNLIAVSTNTSSCVSSSQVWITNLTATPSGTNMVMTFTIAGGSAGVPYDVFANSLLDFTTNSATAWAWMGQGYQCVTYNLTISSSTCFLILGTPQDTSGYGLTDAYEKLVARIDPNGSQSDSFSVPYAWYAENGLGMQSATQDPDLDALLNYQEYLYGTDPNISQGFTIWVSTPNSTSIP